MIAPTRTKGTFKCRTYIIFINLSKKEYKESFPFRTRIGLRFLQLLGVVTIKLG